jgi:hypothetical protein
VAARAFSHCRSPYEIVNINPPRSTVPVRSRVGLGGALSGPGPAARHGPVRRPVGVPGLRQLVLIIRTRQGCSLTAELAHGGEVPGPFDALLRRLPVKVWIEVVTLVPGGFPPPQLPGGLGRTGRIGFRLAASTPSCRGGLRREGLVVYHLLGDVQIGSGCADWG